MCNKPQSDQQAVKFRELKQVGSLPILGQALVYMLFGSRLTLSQNLTKQKNIAYHGY